MRRVKAFLCLISIITILAGCGSGGDISSGIPIITENDKLVIYTSHKPEVYEPIIREFEEQTNIWVDVRTGGTTELLEQISSANDVDGDIMFGGGVESLTAYSDCFKPYISVQGAYLDDSYGSPTNSYTVFSSLPIVIIYNDKLVYSESAPKSFADLLDERWKGKIAFADPSNSGTSYTALATMLQVIDGEEEDIVSAFAGAVGTCVAGSADVVKDVDAGTKLIGVTLEEYALKNKSNGADISIVYPTEGTSAIPDGVAILKSSDNDENARRFIEFVVGKDVQQYIVDNFYRRSVRADIKQVTGQGTVGDGDLISDIKTIDYDIDKASNSQQRILEMWTEYMNR